MSLTGVIIGILMMIYPFISDGIMRRRNEGAISVMASSTVTYDKDGKTGELLLQAEKYNRALAEENDAKEGSILPYLDQLAMPGTAGMAYLEIPKLNIRMVIYHGTTPEVLSAGVGHIEGTSLPVGGENTHCALTAHSGLRSMRAFDNLEKMEEGDRFYVTTLGLRLAYEVRSMEIVLPYETDSLRIIPGEDWMTLITCTPYGVNDHRLLVHGQRIPDSE